MPQWKPDERHRKVIGQFEMVPVRDGQETAHEVTLHDGQIIRVLPDPDYSGQKRSQMILRALTALDAIWRADAGGDSLLALSDDKDRPIIEPLAILSGYLGDLAWETVGDESCEHTDGFEVGLEARHGDMHATVVCPTCGQKWWGLVEPLASDAELARRGL